MPKSKGQNQSSTWSWSLSLAKMKGAWFAAWKVLREGAPGPRAGPSGDPKADLI